MPKVSNLFEMQILLLGFILVGFISAKLKIIDEHSRSSLSDLILDVFLPCNIISSFFDTDRSQLLSLGFIFAVSSGLLILCFLLSKLIYRRYGAEQKKVLLYATIISNASFLGNPVVESVYGSHALIYAAVYLIPLRVALWTLGIAIFSGSKGNIKKAVFHPCLVAVYIGFIIMFTGFNPPRVLSKFIFSLGNCTTPVSMMIVGSVLASGELKKLFSGLAIYFSAIRLIVIPLFVMGAMFVIHPDPVVAGVAVILSAAPAPVTTSILAGKYNSDNDLASRIIFVSTFLSMLTIPAIIWLLQRVV